jgi:DNA polymerase-3 subunit epsilon
MRIEQAAAALEEERDTLATLMAKLKLGVVVCNMNGQVLLYNQQARDMLEGSARESGVGDWIGLGRSIHGLLGEGVIRHAQMTLVHARQRGESAQMVPFLVSRAADQLLNVHLVPISGKRNQWHGYILTFDDVTDRIHRDARRAMAFRTLIQHQRSATSGIRAAIETILSSPEMSHEELAMFHDAIDQEAMKLSEPLDGLEDRIHRELEDQWPQRVVIGADLVAAIERHVNSLLSVNMDVSVPLEPVRLRADSYAIARCHIFLIGQLRQFAHADDLALRLEASAGSVSLILEWTGAPLDMEALREWGMRNVFTDLHGASMTLFEVIEAHSGAIWPQSVGVGGRNSMSIVLPSGEPEAAVVAKALEEDAADHAFDFGLGARGANNGSWIDVALSAINYTVVDTETTGLQPDGGDEIIAIGAVRIINGRILRREVFDTFVNPRVPISKESFTVHGISEDMVRGQPRIEDVLPALHSFCADTIIVGHNVDFDMRFLTNAAKKIGLEFNNPILDTLRLEYLVNRNQPDKDLSVVAERLGIAAGGRHTALGDALTTAEVLLALMPMLEQAGYKTVGEAQVGSDRTPYAKKSF